MPRSDPERRPGAVVAGWLGALALLAAGCGERASPQPPPAAEGAPAAASAADRPAATAAASAAPVSGPSAPRVAAADPAAHELGRKVYNYRCYFCHGYSGDARTLAATYLEPKPRDFTQLAFDAIPRETMLAIVRDGKPNTAMKGFAGIISEEEMAAVTDFVRYEFMLNKAPNTRYHTVENGWPDHEKHRVAFPFARGEIPIDTPWEQLDPEQQRGKRLFLTSCITCHDHARVQDPGKAWETRAVSFPRDAYCVSCHQEIPKGTPSDASHPGERQATHTFSREDGTVPAYRPEDTGTDRIAANYLVHDVPPVIADATPRERRGEALFQKNCAFCHAADGTSKGWIGSFLEPHPRNLASAEEMKGMTAERLLKSIREGVPQTSMPAWRDVLTPEEIEAIAAYISRAFHPVPGVPRS
jgi:cytochrome c oxidase cbb3-type subunit 3